MKKIMFSIIILAALILAGCTQTVTPQVESDQLNVIVSVLPQKAFVEAVGGDLVAVKELIPPGASPATYDPKPSDLVAVENADIYFRIGHVPFEKVHMQTLASLNPSMKVVDTSANVVLRTFADQEAHSHDDDYEAEHHEDDHEEDGEAHNDHEVGHDDYDEGMYGDDHDDHDHSGVDPHIWLSPMQVKIQVDSIAQTLANKDPEHKAVYEANAEAFKAELDALHTEIETELATLRSNKLLVFHPSWGYFADEYGLEQIAIEQSGKEPTAAELQHIIDEVEENNIEVIFVQSQFNKEIAQSVANEIGAVVVSIDPLSEDYINNLRLVATTISQNLN